jgi:hypothetical protein
MGTTVFYYRKDDKYIVRLSHWKLADVETLDFVQWHNDSLRWLAMGCEFEEDQNLGLTHSTE